MNTGTSVVPFGFEPVRAFRALRRLIANPDDTSQVFTIIESFSGFAPRRMVERFRSEANGRRMLATRPNILSLLADRAALERMPEGSLAHAYLAFLDREGITAAGLVEASVEGEKGDYRTAGDFGFISDRLRDTHDLWHAATGYHGDLVGETSLLAFSAAQTRNPGVGLIVLAAIARTRDLELTRMVIDGFRSGRRAEWFPAAPWEDLLPLPIEEARARLGVKAVAPYVPMRSSWLRETGELAAS